MYATVTSDIKLAMTPDDELLKEGLELIRTQLPHKPPSMAYRWSYDFVLRHGVFFPVQRFPSGISRGASKQCFGNAFILAATRGFRYIEGYALGLHSPLPTLHAWNIDNFGVLIDNTWLNTGLSYMGVEFSVERANDAIWDGDSCVLDDFNRQWPLFQEEWKGESPDATWPSSERLGLLREGKIFEALTLVTAELENEKHAKP
jgi:hypothetical protein